MPASAYPTPDLGGPQWLRYTPAAADYDAVTVSSSYQDGGLSTVTEADTGVLVWDIEYDGLDEREVKPLDEHYDEAFGQANSFTFTDREGVSHAGVRYAKGGFEKSHTLQSIQRRVVRLTKFP